MDHEKLAGLRVPSIISFTYDDEADRLAATGFIVEDVGKIALQSSDGTLWRLKTTSPLWGPFNQGVQLVGAYQRTLPIDTVSADWLTIGSGDEAGQGPARIESPGGGIVEKYIFKVSLDVVAGVSPNVSIRIVITSDGYFMVPGGITTRAFAATDSTGIELSTSYAFDPGSITGYEVQLLGTDAIDVSATVSRLCFTIEKNSVS
jgi:hypothetical protein